MQATKPRTCYLHVGTGKTGSSAVQFALVHHREALLARGYCYPDISANFDAVLRCTPTAGNAIQVVRLLRDGQVEKALHLVAKYAKPVRHLVLSCEGIWHLSPAVLQDFAAGLRSLGFRTRALVVFRPQLEFVASSYSQRIKSNKSDTRLPLDDYAEQKFSAAKLVKSYNWAVRSARLERAFHDLTVNWYPALRRQGPEGVPRAVFAWLGQAPLFKGLPEQVSIVNASPTREMLFWLQRLNEVGIGGVGFANEFLRKAQDAGFVGTPVTVGPTQAQRIFDATVESNTRLLQRYCVDLDPSKELIPPSASARAEDPFDPPIVAGLGEIAQAILKPAHPALAARVAAMCNTADVFGSIGESGQQKPSLCATPPERRCIIHVGMHKTGSTSIQVSLNGFENEEFLYASMVDDSNHSLPIYSLFSDSPQKHHLHVNADRGPDAVRDYIERVRADLEKSIARAGNRTLLISGEDIAVLPQSSIDALQRYLATRFSQVRVVAYVRPPNEFISSAFQQHLKGGAVTRLEPQRLYRNYKASFSKFDRSFGKENVQLWKFDPKEFSDGCVVRDFCERLAIALPKSRIARVNESLSREAVCLLYAYRRFGPIDETKKMRGLGATRLGELVGGRKFRFSPDFIRPILESNISDIDWIEQRLGRSVAQNLGEHQAGDIRHEEDLFEFDRAAIAKVAKAVGRDASAISTPHDVAELVAVWHEVFLRARREERQRRRFFPSSIRIPLWH